ncbi:D-alanyl-D-alanine carboxypeptidase/D-alanyl-D-alanine-endopeptidase [Parenemella sanctibonifatiensis]|uniref:D-alanyl-D-alanine carboxypeptidase/D-alanyl-D-alanine-endopeptidase n=1 Tax=Parenemella sanctibonifatiensis TaxID=2016505 RepID=A0A255EWU9_9ACTN|nr:D-alanyl-D-alanine carboxypeptidase/D-alanyl-D-alanine-endopeptidase [Parenemella sanctibonifatiensis]
MVEAPRSRRLWREGGPVTRKRAAGSKRTTSRSGLALLGVTVAVWLVVLLALSPVLHALGIWAPNSAAGAPVLHEEDQPPGVAPALAPLALPDDLGADPIDLPALAARLDAVAPPQGQLGMVVLDSEGAELINRGADTGLMPASSMKVATAVLVLDALGGDHRFTTEVVAHEGELWLVGGGDPSLATAPDQNGAEADDATLTDLADQTAEQLAGQNVVTLHWDATLFPGAGWNPTWPPGYGNQAAPTSALWVDGARQAPGSGARQADPARSAATVFAQLLQERGITVTLGEASQQPEQARHLASVESPPLDVLVRHLLMVSDNDYTEVVFRHIAIAAGQPGTIEAAQQVVTERLTELGVRHEADRVIDGSGLSRENRLTARTLASLIQLALSRPDLQSVFTGLPTAGVDGSLAGRFESGPAAPGRGHVHGKTGSLTGVTSLTGYLVGADGEVYIYSVILNDAADTWDARRYVDEIGAALAGCGCAVG